MGKQLINQVECQHCKRMFDVNTEDIEWEHVADLGENDIHAPLHDKGLVQKIQCAYPDCRKENTIVYKALEDPKTGDIVNQKVIEI